MISDLLTIKSPPKRRVKPNIPGQRPHDGRFFVLKNYRCRGKNAANKSGLAIRRVCRGIFYTKADIACPTARLRAVARQDKQCLMLIYWRLS